MKKFNYKSVMEVPKLEKIVINIGLGDIKDNPKSLENAMNDIKIITGQAPIVTKAKKAIAAFKIREGVNMGCKVTLRAGKMYDFAQKLFNVALPIPDDVEYHDSWFSACACCMNGLNYSFEPITNYRIHSFNASGDHKITLMRQVKNTFNRGKFRTDRLCFITEIQKRMSNFSDSIQKILIEAEQFHLNRINNKRLKVISYLIRNYKCIYSVKNYNRIFLRCIAILFWG